MSNIQICICCRHLIKDHQSTVTFHPESPEKTGDPSDLDSPMTPSQTVVRRTKTKTQSRILGNGDLLEQTVVKEVTETVTTSVCRQERCEECQARCQDFTEQINREISREQMEEELDEETVSELIEDKVDDERPVPEVPEDPVVREEELLDSTTSVPPETAYIKMGKRFPYKATP